MAIKKIIIPIIAIIMLFLLSFLFLYRTSAGPQKDKTKFIESGKNNKQKEFALFKKGLKLNLNLKNQKPTSSPFIPKSPKYREEFNKNSASKNFTSKNSQKTKTTNLEESQQIIEPVLSPVKPIFKPKNLKEPDILAKSYIVYDVKNASPILIKNPNNTLKIASLTKILTAITAIENFDIEKEVISVPEKLNGLEEEYRIFSTNDKINAKDLIYAMLIASSNEAALLLKNHFEKKYNIDFISLINKTAKKIGLYNTYISNPVGYDSPPNTSNIFDLLTLALYAKNFDIFKDSAQKKSVKIKGTLQNYYLRSTNEYFISHIENNKDFKILLVKTGTSQEAKENLIMYLKYKEKEIILIILNSKERINDYNKLIDFIINYYSKINGGDKS